MTTTTQVVHRMDRHTLHLDCDEPDDAALAAFARSRVTCTACIAVALEDLEDADLYTVARELTGRRYLARIRSRVGDDWSTECVWCVL